MQTNYNWTTDLQETIQDLTGEAMMLELYLHGQESSDLSHFPPEHRRRLLRRISDYITQHALDLNTLARYLEEH